MRRSRQLIDVSHTIEHGMITYRGLPAPVIRDHLSRQASQAIYAAGTEFHIASIEMVANTGTYIDAPFHRYADGSDIAGYSLSDVADLDGVTRRALDRSGGRAIDDSYLQGCEMRGKAVIFHTGWDVHWRTEQYFGNHPFLTRGAAEYLIGAGAALVGIDSYNIDDTSDMTRPVHSLLLGAGIPVVEHLCNLAALPDDNYQFFAVPAKIKGMGTFPVRAFAVVFER